MEAMLSKKLLAKTDSNNTTDFEVPEKMKNLTEEDFINKARAGRKRHSVQLDKRITQQLLDGKVDRRSSNASSYAESTDSLCKFLHCWHLLVAWCFLEFSCPVKWRVENLSMFPYNLKILTCYEYFVSQCYQVGKDVPQVVTQTRDPLLVSQLLYLLSL